MEKILRKENIGEWLAALEAYDLHAPAFSDSVWNYARVESTNAIELDHTNTVRSIKEFAFPQREVFFRFEQEKGGTPTLTPTVPDTRPTVIFGVRPCDGRGMPRNDKVFTAEFKDPYYWARREKLTLIGLACNEPHSQNCFCQSVGGAPNSEEGLDVLMTDLGDRFHVKGVTGRGIEIMVHGSDAFDDARKDDKAEVEKTHAAACEVPQRGFGDLSKIPDAIRKNFEAPVWQELAQACIGCGICTFLCPTCHCFDINDEVTCQSPCSGERVRTWDNCQFPDFTMHTSGHNPRHDLGSRLRQRVSHKFLYFVENHKTQQCTGCGRCISECPVGIDIVRVLDTVSQQS
jgi:sulfhydrogenase subunit beta (sulfur reductase)